MVNHPNRRRRIASGAAAVIEARAPHRVDPDFETLRSAVRLAFARTAGRPLFVTDADANEALWNLYLDRLPVNQRRVHTCSACRRFVGSFGSLAIVEDDGSLTPAMWNPTLVTPEPYRLAVEELTRRVHRARITGPFLTSRAVLGTPETPPWTHLAVNGAPVYRHALLTPGQRAAELREAYRTVATALTELRAPVIDEALRVLRAEALPDSQKFVAPLEWLRKLHDRPRGRTGENLLWLAVVTAPEGYLHPRAAVTATLLEDVEAGRPFDEIRRRWAEKVHPLRYQRPQAAPTAANVAVAEAIVEKLGIARSFERRFARLDEVEKLWEPAPTRPPAPGGVFAGIATKAPRGTADPPAVELPMTVITWEKFARTLLPSADAFELAVPPHGPFIALVTAVHADAPPIIEWDREDRRNPVSWYVYSGGSPAIQWGLTAGWRRVTAAVPLPCLWGDRPLTHVSEGITLALEGARDTRCDSMALFPELLRGELRAVRATIEAHSRRSRMGNAADPLASGYDLRRGHFNPVTVRALIGGRWGAYRLDRWD